MKLRLHFIWLQALVIGVLGGTNAQPTTEFDIFIAPNSALTIDYPVGWFATADSPDAILVSNVDAFDQIKKFCNVDALNVCGLEAEQEVVSFELIRNSSLVKYGIDIQSEISPLSIVSKIMPVLYDNADIDSFTINGHSAARIKSSVQSLIILKLTENVYAKVNVAMEAADLQEFEPILMTMLESLHYVPSPGINIPLEQITSENVHRLTLLSTISTNQQISDINFSPDSAQLVTAGWDRWASLGMKLWNLATGEIVASDPRQTYLARYSPEGDAIGVISFADAFDIRVWDVSLRSVLWYGIQLPPGKGVNPTIDFVFSPDGKRFAFSSLDNKLHIWDNGRIKQEVAELNAHTQGYIQLAYSPNTRILASISWFEDDIRLWDAATGESVGLLAADNVSEIAFSPDSQLIAAVSDVGISVFDVGTKREIMTLPSVDGQVIRFLPTLDDLLLAVFDEMQGGLSIWQLSTESQIFHIQARYINKEGIGYIRTQFAVSPNGKLLATGTHDVHIWGVPALQ
jgi:WD40 repeat protein